MAVKRSLGAVSKSDAVREYLSAHAGAPVKEIVAGLSQQGVEVSLALVNKIKYNDRPPGSRSAGHGRAGRGAAGKGASKAQAIREALGHLGRNARPRDVIAHLKAGGVSVSAAQVSLIRKKFRGSSRRQGSTSGLSTRPHLSTGIAVEHLIAAKRLADLVGLDAAKRALDFLSILSP